jgi:peptidase M23-like protein
MKITPNGRDFAYPHPRVTLRIVSVWTRAAVALGGLLALVVAACTEHVPVGPVGQFSWEPQSQMIWPTEGAIVSAYGDAARANHQGIDLAARPGDPVAAALGGNVVYTGEIRGYGKVVAISHGETLTTIYAHLGELRVHEGEAVVVGQTVGTIGPDGYLHYEIRESKRAVDPAKYYAVAPHPVVGGAADVSGKLPQEPTSVGEVPPSGPTAEAPPLLPPPTPQTRVAQLEPTPRSQPTRTPRPQVTPTPRPQPTPTSRPQATPTARPQPTAKPTPRRLTAEPTPKPSEAEEQAAGASGWSGVGLVAALVGCNLVYVPAKLAYAAVGAIVGGAALVLSRDPAVANDVWRPALGGDYVVTAAHLRGEEALHFAGARAETPAPSPPPKPSRRPRGS